MFHVSDVLKLQPHEKVLRITRAHSMALVGRLAGFAVLIILPCFFLFPLFRIGWVGMLIFLLPVLIGVLGAWRAVRLWDATVLILTDHRLVHVSQRGLWNRHVSEVTFSHIGDVQWEKRGFFASIFGIGTVRLRTNGGSIPAITMTGLAGPDRLAQAIQELRAHGVPNSHQAGSPTAPTPKQALEIRRERLIHAIQQATEDELAKFEEALEERV